MNEIPVVLFIFLVIFLLACLAISISNVSGLNVVTGIIVVTLSYMLSKVCINGQLVNSFGGLSTTDVIVSGPRSITSLPLSYIFLFIAVMAVLITVVNIVSEIKYNLEPDIGELDYV